MATPRPVRLGSSLRRDEATDHAEIIRMLLAAGADVNGRRGTQGRDSPVCAAALDAHLDATSEAPAGLPAWLEDYLQREGYKVLNDARSRGAPNFDQRLKDLARIEGLFSGRGYDASRLLEKEFVAFLVVHGITLDEIAVPDLDLLDDELRVWFMLFYDTRERKGPTTNEHQRCWASVVRIFLERSGRGSALMTDALPLKFTPSNGKGGQKTEAEIAKEFDARIRDAGIDPGRVLSLYSELLLSVAKEGGLGDRPTIYTMGGGAEEHAPRMFVGRATIVKGLRHPQWLLDFERTIKNLESLVEEIRAREYEPGKEWSVVDPLESLRLHDAVASRVLSVLAGKPVTYTGGMDLYNNTNGAREKLRALRDELLGPLGQTASLVLKKQCDLAHLFARLAERDRPVPPHLSGEARDEFLRLTSLASVDPTAALRCAFLSHDAGAMDCSSDAPAAGSPGTPSSLKEWYDAIPEEVRADALHVACNARHVSVARRRWLGDFSDDTFVAEAAARDYIIAPADARGSATRIFPPAAAPREQRDLVARVRTPSATRRAPRRSRTPPSSRRCRATCSRPRSRRRATRGT